MTTRSDNPQLRITSWPEDPLAIPPIARRPVELAQDTFLVFGAASGESAALPEEFYRRELAEIGEADVEEWARFSATWGPVALPGARSLIGCFDLPTQVQVDTHRDSRVMAELDPDQVFARAQSESNDFVMASETLRPSNVLHIAQARFHSRLVRALTRHLDAHLGPGRESVLEAWADEKFPAPIDERQAWKWFAETLNAALRVAHPRLFVGGGDANLIVPTIYPAACLQLRNNLVEGAVARHCANEKCGRLFFRQRGRAAAGQYRTSGVRFCSSSCAKAQAVREHRRRQKQVNDRSDR